MSVKVIPVGALIVGEMIVVATIVGPMTVGAMIVGAMIVGATIVGAVIVGAMIVGAWLGKAKRSYMFTSTVSRCCLLVWHGRMIVVAMSMMRLLRTAGMHGFTLKGSHYVTILH